MFCWVYLTSFFVTGSLFVVDILLVSVGDFYSSLAYLVNVSGYFFGLYTP